MDNPDTHLHDWHRNRGKNICVSLISILSLFLCQSCICVRVIHFASVSVSTLTHIYMTDTETGKMDNLDTHLHDWHRNRGKLDKIDTHIYDWHRNRGKMDNPDTICVSGLSILPLFLCQSYICVSMLSILPLFLCQSCICVRVIHFASVSVSVMYMCQGYPFCLCFCVSHFTWLTQKQRQNG
jgi:hypothetical protein